MASAAVVEVGLAGLDRVEGVLVRLSDSPIVNVTSGGGETGFYVIEGEKP